jgi:hypothetical protein
MGHRSPNVGEIGLLDGLLQQRFNERAQLALMGTALMIRGNQTADVLVTLQITMKPPRNGASSKIKKGLHRRRSLTSMKHLMTISGNG